MTILARTRTVVTRPTRTVVTRPTRSSPARPLPFGDGIDLAPRPGAYKATSAPLPVVEVGSESAHDRHRRESLDVADAIELGRANSVPLDREARARLTLAMAQVEESIAYRYSCYRVNIEDCRDAAIMFAEIERADALARMEWEATQARWSDRLCGIELEAEAEADPMLAIGACG